MIPLDLDTIAYMLYLDDWLNEDESLSNIYETGMSLSKLKEKWDTAWLPLSREEHSGDCTKQAGPCVRCIVEQYYADAAKIVEGSKSSRDFIKNG